MPGPASSSVAIRRATIDDAASICSVWENIVSEPGLSAVDRPFTLQGEIEYIRSLSDREAIFVAETEAAIVGFQSLDLWSKVLRSMDHVGALGTEILRDWRGRGVGGKLAAHTFEFARSVGYEKLVVYVRASNPAAQKYYARLGFAPCGRLARQVKISGGYDDEILMELLV